MTAVRNPARGMAALRRLAAPRPAVEHCDLCAARVSEEHQHLIDPENRRLLCACDACAILFDQSGATKYRRVRRDVFALPGFHIDDALWNSFAIPIGLVFFFRSSVSQSVLAVYPSPGGPAEIAIDARDWSEVAAMHPRVSELLEDVEALLVNRMKSARDYYVVPIDQCYKLTGMIRRHWSGFSGGDRVWEEIRLFFERLRNVGQVPDQPVQRSCRA